MIKDIIGQIKESEKKAEEIIAYSKKESSKIIEKAYRKANSKLQNTEKKAKKLLNEAEARAIEDANIEKTRLEAEYDKKIKAIRDDSRGKREEAIQKLVDRVLG
jgi:vacuolar-type H+-ATPase subunit H